MSNIATTTRIERKKHTHTHLRTLLTGTRSSVAHLNAPCGIDPTTHRTMDGDYTMETVCVCVCVCVCVWYICVCAVCMGSEM